MLSSSKILVTGASSGIGLSTCEILTKYDAQVIGVGRNESALKELKDKKHIIDYIVADLCEDGICENVVSEAVQKLNGLTALINAAGVLKGGGMGDEAVNLANYQYNMKMNAQVPFELMTYAVPHLRVAAKTKALCPSIVNVSSVNGKQSFPKCVTYCMSKAAVDSLTKCSSVDLAEDGIRVNAVNPGVIETNLQKRGGLTDEQYQAFLQRSIESTHPLAKSLGRVGQPEEVAELIAFLVSDKAKFLTGECIAIDGGRQNLGAR